MSEVLEFAKKLFLSGKPFNEVDILTQLSYDEGVELNEFANKYSSEIQKAREEWKKKQAAREEKKVIVEKQTNTSTSTIASEKTAEKKQEKEPSPPLNEVSSPPPLNRNVVKGESRNGYYFTISISTFMKYKELFNARYKLCEGEVTKREFRSLMPSVLSLHILELSLLSAKEIYDLTNEKVTEEHQELLLSPSSSMPKVYIQLSPFVGEKLEEIYQKVGRSYYSKAHFCRHLLFFSFRYSQKKSL